MQPKAWMRWLTAGALASASLIAQAQSPAPAATSAVPRQYDLRDFFRNPERAYFRLSPDGKWLSYMQPWENRLNVYVQPLQDGKPVGEPRRLTSETARDISIYYWKGPDRILYVKDFGGDENFHVVSVDVKTGQVQDLTPGDKVRAEIIDDLEQHSTDILISHNRRDPKVFDVYRVNVATGESRLVAQNPGNVTGWVTDHEGTVRVAIASDGVNRTFMTRAKDGEPFSKVFTTSFREEVEPQVFTPDNRRLYANSNRGRDKKAIVLMDPATGKEEQVVFVHPEVDAWSVGYSKLRKTPTSIEYMTDRIERKHLDAQTAKMYAALERQLPGMQISLQAHTKDERLWIVAASSDRTPGTRYLYDAKADALTKLGDINPWIAAADMAPMKPIHYTARDGTVIHGYLTLPVGRPAKNLPVIVNPHGGPWARDAWGYNPEVQFLANRGYAVFQPNFRGSTGYGRAFWEKSFKQWGRTMQDDITDGVNWLVAQGIADPKRVGIYGASYGGYATLAGITLTPELYAAAVSYVGVSNMFTFMSTIPPYWEPLRAMFYEMVGNPETEKEMLRAVSPVFLADRIRTPLFVAQGAKDPRVNKAESDQIVEALKKRGVPVEYMVKDNEGHGFRNQENQFEFYGAMEQFLGKHLAKQ
jgi:dipeptidyl aminopeptidase/acylaminoacyl peptidase